VIERTDPANTWVKWEIAAVNDAGTGEYRTARVIVPNVVGTFSWEAYQAARAVGLMAGGDTPYDCGQGTDTICSQSLVAGTTSTSGTAFYLAENT
jgi:hypothetical protein